MLTKRTSKPQNALAEEKLSSASIEITHAISDQTVRALVRMLKVFAYSGAGETRGQARGEFIHYIETLSPEEKKQLMEHVIRLPHPWQNEEDLAFATVLIDENLDLKLTQIYLWKFLVDVRPSDFPRVPACSYDVLDRYVSTAKIYLNQETFLYQTILSSQKIEELQNENRLLELDNYAFDVDELKEYVDHEIGKIYRNPHKTERNSNHEFSDEAKAILSSHPILGEYVRRFEDRLTKQAEYIREETVDAVIIYLNALAEESEDISATAHEARVALFQHIDKLSLEEKNQLMNYIIRLPSLLGGTMNRRFENSFEDGGCIQTTQMYGWQFAYDMRPSVYASIPASVHRLPDMSLNFIGSPEDSPGLRLSQHILDVMDNPLREFRRQLLTLVNRGTEIQNELNTRSKLRTYIDLLNFLICMGG